MAIVTTDSAASSSRTLGSQTLARGITGLKAIAGSRDGLTIQQLADQLGVHRTIASRLTNTLSDAGLIRRNEDGRFRGSSGLLALSGAAYSAARAVALPLLADVANELGLTVSLMVREGAEVVTLAVVEPLAPSYRISFAPGSRHPLNRGAAGAAIRASWPPSPADPEAVHEARQRGYAVSFAEVEPGMYGVAVPLAGAALGFDACINLITMRAEQVTASVPALLGAARLIEAGLG